MTRSIPLEDGGTLLFTEGWLSEAEQAALADALWSQPWDQEKVRIMGRMIPQPRLTCSWADPGTRYSYSGLTIAPSPWFEALAAIKARLERELSHPFTYALGNLYRGGDDSIGFHADDEPELGPDPVIASLSLGGARRFVLKHQTRALPPVELSLTPGSLLVMAGTTQRHWHHGVPKTRKPVSPRINLTFRRINGNRPAGF